MKSAKLGGFYSLLNIETEEIVRSLPNLGASSWLMLERAGISTTEAVKELGAVRSYLAVLESGGKPSLNLLYAIAAGLEGRSWQDLSADEKGRLNRELDDLRELSV